MKKNTIPKPITILVLSLLTTLLWISLSIYRSLTVKPPTIVSTNIAKPINPNLNMEVIEKINSSIFIPDSEIPPLNIESSVVFTTPIPISTPEPIIEATKSATETSQI